MATLDHSSKRPSLPTSSSVRKTLLEIDDMGKNCSVAIDELFDRLDTQNSGFLEGDAYANFMKEVVDLMTEQWRDAGLAMDAEDIKLWCEETLDSNGDHRISRKEMQASLKTVLDADENGLDM